MLSNTEFLQESPIRAAITQAYRQDETEAVNYLLQTLEFSASAKARIQERATRLVEEVRKQRIGKSGIDSFMYEYNLSSDEGIALMCLAEALLRIPDPATIDKLITDKISKADWEAHLGKSESLFVNAATWGLMLTGRIYAPYADQSQSFAKVFRQLVRRSGEPVIRKAIGHAMRVLGKQFVMGRTIVEALERAKEAEKKGYRFSYDMLGEAARTQHDAEKYFQAYQKAIATVSAAAKSQKVHENPGISVKLSALHPRYEFSQAQRVIAEVVPKLKALALLAKQGNIGLTVDAEEADRLDLSLDIMERAFADPDLHGWEGFGLALQSYQKRAWYVIDWIVDLARKYKRRWMVRLIKGAYWDSEIKLSQERGLQDYPVFTRKMNTDVSFLACAQKLLKFPQEIYPQFATHNAYSVSAVLEMVGERKDFEFQCLHGMGRALYDQIVGTEDLNYPCRVYAPVGSHEDLLPYLVRRLLENGANTSFVNRIADIKQPIAEIVADPVEKVRHLKAVPHPGIPLPRNIYFPERLNATGIDLSSRQQLAQLKQAMEQAAKKKYSVAPAVLSKNPNPRVAVTSPKDHHEVVGEVILANAEEIHLALEKADKIAFSWDQIPAGTRAACLEKAAELFEQHQAELIALTIREAGKTIPDAQAEVREAVDFCRYYAFHGRKLFAQPEILPGPTGEKNQMQLHGRGPIVCISPWNFPLAIFTGQVAAALMAGNPVLAKPAEQTPLIAARAVELMHSAGIPKDVLQLLPARGSLIGKHLIPDVRLKGVVFTGSTETAQIINRTLAAREGALTPMIAETGGQNAMIVDSSALVEQVILDVLTSSFYSAGQRCSALRVLFIQEEIAEKFLTMLKGAMQELVIGDPASLGTDIGPVIDADAQAALQAHAEKMRREARLIYQATIPAGFENGSYFAPCAFEIPDIRILTREVFGPILHVVRYKAKDLDQVIDAVNSSGYGLTLGIHTRIEETAQYIQRRIRVGNSYVNRNMVGAVVGVQPFGGEGLSGTGPKAGGPHYLLRLCTERTLSVNTAAAGGNAALMTLQDDAD